MEKTTLVSVIISTRNEADVIGKLLASIKKQSFKSNEIIVVDNNSQDKTKAIAKKFTERVFNYGPERSAQRNFGAKKAKGKYLLFLDADMELTRRVIEECIAKIKRVKNTGGVIIPEISVGKYFWEKAKAFERSFYFEEGGLAIEAARFFTKEAFSQTSGYDERVTGKEDWELSESVRKSGLRITRIASPLYHHETIPSLVNFAQKYYYYGLTVHRVLKKQNTSFIGPETIPFLRPVFYKKFHRFFAHPILSIGMFILLSTQLGASGVGFTIGKVKHL
jgi:glycosyltransferase involved in cell wall biosynthesis